MKSKDCEKKALSNTYRQRNNAKFSATKIDSRTIILERKK